MPSLLCPRGLPGRQDSPTPPHPIPPWDDERVDPFISSTEWDVLTFKGFVALWLWFWFFLELETEPQGLIRAPQVLALWALSLRVCALK